MQIANGTRVRAVANGRNGGWTNPTYHDKPGTVVAYDGEYWLIRFDDKELGDCKLWHEEFRIADRSPFEQSFSDYIASELGASIDP